MKRLFSRAFIICLCCLGGTLASQVLLGSIRSLLCVVSIGIVCSPWKLISISNVAFVAAADFLLYGSPYFVAYKLRGFFKLGRYFEFLVACVVTVFTAFGLPLLINAPIQNAAAKSRAADIRNPLPSLNEVHSLASEGYECGRDCEHFLLSGRFDHFTIVSFGVLRLNTGEPSIPSSLSGTEFSISMGADCSDLRKKPIPINGSAGCIISQEVKSVGDDVVVLHTDWSPSIDERKGGQLRGIEKLDSVQRFLIGVRKGTRTDPQYEWTIETHPVYHIVGPIFFLLSTDDWLRLFDLPRVVVGVAPDSQLIQYASSLVAPQ